jgi:hypothetical protein
MWNADPVATERLLDELSPGVGGGVGVDEGLPSEWFGRNVTPSRPPSAAEIEAEGLPWVPLRKTPRTGRDA